MQHPVHAHAHGEALLGGLHVDVGRFEIHRLGEQVADQFDHRRLFRHLPQLLGVVLGEEALDRALFAHEVQQPVDLVVGGQVEGGRPPGIEVAQRLEQCVFLDVARNAAEFAVAFPQDRAVVEEPVELDRRLGEEPVDRQVVREVGGIAQVHGVLLLGKGSEEDVLRQRPRAHQECA